MSKLRDFSQLPNILFDMDLLSEDSYLVGFLRFWRHYATRKETFRGSYRKLANLIRMPKSCVARMVPEWERAGFVTKETKTKEGENREEMVLTINVEAFWEFNYAYYPERPKLGQQNIIVPPNISSENNSVPNWDSNVPPRDTSVSNWDKSVPRASSNSDVILGNTTVILNGNSKDTFGASLDSAALTQLQEKNHNLEEELAAVKALLKEVRNALPTQGSDQKGHASPTTAGQGETNAVTSRDIDASRYPADLRSSNNTRPHSVLEAHTKAELNSTVLDGGNSLQSFFTPTEECVCGVCQRVYKNKDLLASEGENAPCGHPKSMCFDVKDTPPDQDALQSPTIDEKQPCVESQGRVALSIQDKPSESQRSATESTSSVPAHDESSNQATEQGKQANGVSDSQSTTTKSTKSTGGRGKGKGKEKVIQAPLMEEEEKETPPPVEPPAEMKWGTRKCLLLFDFWRGVPLLTDFKLMQASKSAKQLATYYTEDEVRLGKKRMDADDYYKKRGSVDIMDVANNIQRYVKKKSHLSIVSTNSTNQEKRPIASTEGSQYIVDEIEEAALASIAAMEG